MQRGKGTLKGIDCFMFTASPYRYVHGKKLLVMGSGSGSNFEALVRTLRPYGALFSGLFCDRHDAYILRRAENLGVTSVTLQPEEREPTKRVSTETLNTAVDTFLAQPFDLVLLAGYMRILPAQTVQRHNSKILNIHPSLLPHYPGLHAIRRAWEANEKRVGVSVHIVTEHVDAGPLVGQVSISTRNIESLEQLTQQVHRVEHKLYPLMLARHFEKGMTAQPWRGTEYELELFQNELHTQEYGTTEQI